MPHHSTIPLFHDSTLPIRAITFDVGGTLIRPWPSVGHIYSAVAARHGLNGIAIEVLNRQFAAAWKNLDAFNYTRSEWFNLVNQTFLDLTQTPLSESFFSDLYRHFERADAWRIFDDAVPTLRSLASFGLKLGIISNWDERLRPLLRGLHLDHYFDSIVISCEVGACKPSPAIFQQAARALNLSAGSILHIGDSPEMDVSGAMACGFHTLLLVREEVPKPGQLSSLLDLQTYIKPA